MDVILAPMTSAVIVNVTYKMRKIALFMLGMLMLSTGMLMQYSSLHNIDLSWNAKYVGLIDNNGYVSQDMTQMYSKSYVNLWLTPLMTILGTMLICFGFIKDEVNRYYA